MSIWYPTSVSVCEGAMAPDLLASGSVSAPSKDSALNSRSGRGDSAAVSHFCSSGGLAAAAATSEGRHPYASAELWHVRMLVASVMIWARGAELVRPQDGSHLAAQMPLAL
eukprot:scaffold2065_cov114-Isochrysis_galbana.AAC.5